MGNLLKETVELIERYGYFANDVIWVGSQDGSYAITWAEFEAIADVEYHDGFGAPEIAQDLVVVGQDWWLERGEYDGSEWWEFKRIPEREPTTKKFNRVVVRENQIGWKDIDELASEE